MNINTLRRNYDQLSAAERFNLILEAAARGDDREREALLESAPKVGYDLSQHFLRATAADHLAALHLVEMYSQGCALYFGESVLRMLETKAEAEAAKLARSEVIYDSMQQIAKNILTQAEAWRAWCAAEGLDPDKVLLHFPGAGPDKYDTYPFLVSMAEKLAEADPEEVKALADATGEAFQALGGNS